MPIPLLLIAGAGSAALGVGKGVKAMHDQKKADEINDAARYVVDIATEDANVSRKNSGKAIEALGLKKVWVLNNSVKTFVELFEQLHGVELGSSPGLDELKQFRLDRQGFCGLKRLSSLSSSLIGGLAGGASAGALIAFGAYSGAATLGTCSTGTTIAALHGVAAHNATLAFLGGGALSASGAGMAGGMAVLGGLVAGPALAIMGFIAGAKASANKHAAYLNLERARKYEEEVKTVQVLCKAIRLRANLFERLLIQLDAVFGPLTEKLEEIIRTSGTDFSRYSEEEKAVVAANLAAAKAIKAVLDTPILTQDGRLTEESQTVVQPVRQVIQSCGNA